MTSWGDAKHATNLHGEVRVVLVVGEDIPDSLVDHGEECAQSSEPGVVHDVLHLCAKLQAFVDQAISYKVRLQDGGTVSLNLHNPDNR